MSSIVSIKSIHAMEDLARGWNYSPSIALVPTMGYLHEGHLNLVKQAKKVSNFVVVSIFVNPIQFGPGEDLNRYPRDLERDLALLQDVGANVIFIPDAGELTPSTMRTQIDPGNMGEVLCGRYRPGHFAGVATIVAKLFNIVRPGNAIFGWKDAQQFIILKQMVRDLNMPVALTGIETTRETDGLAMSSRNSYLNPAQREAASTIYRELLKIKAMGMTNKNTSSDHLRSEFEKAINSNPELKTQYIEIVSRQTLEPLTTIVPNDTLVATAVYAGSTRLIDNVRL